MSTLDFKMSAIETSRVAMFVVARGLLANGH